MQQKIGKRLVLFPMPYIGHQNPTFDLATILHSKGFSISIIHTHFHSPNPENYPNFTFHFIQDNFSSLPYEDPLALTNLLNRTCVEPFKACLAQIVSNGCSVQEPVVCLIADVMWHFTQGVADVIGVPRMAIRTGSVSSFAMFCARLDVGDKQPDDFVPELPYLKFKDIPGVGVADNSPLQDLLSNLVRQTKASKGLIFNSIGEFESHSLAITQQEINIPIFALGPFYKCLSSPSTNLLSPQDQTLFSWLDTQKRDSVIYVSFGSLATVDQTGFFEMANGLADSEQPFLWVVRGDLVKRSNGSSQFPKGFLEKVSKRGNIISWAPQKEVLAHPAVGAFWTHCGWNSTLESICEGVPMICSPCFGDQMANARYVSDVWRVGLWVEKGAKTEEFEKAIRTVLVEKGVEIRERAKCLKDKASGCLQSGGSSYENMRDLLNLIMSF